MKKLNYCLLTIFLSLLSCKEEQQTVRDKTIIPVAEAVGIGKILNLSDYAKSVEYIPLQTNDKVMVGDIEECVYEKGIIILWDFQNRMCFLFNTKGEFIRQVGNKGEGPEEYIAVKGLNVLSEQDLFFLNGYPRRYYFYDLDGNFIKQTAYPDYPDTYIPWSTIALNTSLLFSDLTSPEHLYYRGMFLGDELEGKHELFMNYMDREKEKKGGWGGYESAFIWNRKDSVRYFRVLNDTVFSISPDRKIEKRFVFDLGTYRIPFSALMNHDRNEKYIRFIFNGIKESSEYLFLNFNFGQHAPEVFERTSRDKRGKVATRKIKNVYGLFQKSTGALTLLNQPVKKQLGFKNDLDGGPCFWPQYISSDDKMVAWWNAEDFLEIYNQLENPSPELKKIAEKLSPEDNPVLMVVTLK